MPIRGLGVSRHFWFKVYQRGDCWEWRGSRDRYGYGQLRVVTAGRPRGQLRLAHRLAYELAVGAIPRGAVLDHLYHHPWGVRPSRLQAVSQSTNLRRGIGVGKYQRRKPR